MPEQGDILLVPIPFTDLSSQKRRPVIVDSNNAYNHKTIDLVVVAMTSNPAEFDYSFGITSSDLIIVLALLPWMRTRLLELSVPILRKNKNESYYQTHIPWSIALDG